MPYVKHFFLKSIILQILLVLVFWNQQQQAQAEPACTWTDNNGPRTAVFIVPDLTIPRDTPIGTRIYTTTATTTKTKFYCSRQQIGIKNRLGQSEPVGSDNTFSMGNTGLGYKLTDSGNNRFFKPYPTLYSANWIFGEDAFTLDIYKISQVKDDNEVQAGVFAEFVAPDLTPAPISFELQNSFRIVSATCVIAPVPPVNMGQQKSENFKTINSRSTPVSFNIKLSNCPSLKKVTYQLDPTTSILSYNNSIVALDQSSTAEGIGIQILDNNDKPLPLNKPNPLIENLQTSDSFTIPMKAAYIKTQDTVKAGSANASLTFTIYYE